MKHEVTEAAASVAKAATIPATGWTLYQVTLQDAVLILTAVSLLIQIAVQLVKLRKTLRGGEQ